MKASGPSTYIAFVWVKKGLMNFFFLLKCMLEFKKRQCSDSFEGIVGRSAADLWYLYQRRCEVIIYSFLLKSRRNARGSARDLHNASASRKSLELMCLCAKGETLIWSPKLKLTCNSSWNHSVTHTEQHSDISPQFVIHEVFAAGLNRTGLVSAVDLGAQILAIRKATSLCFALVPAAVPSETAAADCTAWSYLWLRTASAELAGDRSSHSGSRPLTGDNPRIHDWN